MISIALDVQRNDVALAMSYNSARRLAPEPLALKRKRMIRRITRTIGMFALALLLALASAWWTIFYAPRSQAIKNGPWQMSPMAGSTDAGLHTRALIAVTGLFALNSTETIYFSAQESDAHQR